ncbi:2-amino-4-oxopentanoate thiolase subunit OrtB [Isachenkonia alkalipeptolytica]|uniref:PLP-dependent lyase/thiolase n=1 Tax=Isachenkonia alkalipeptolytica TaxID=2565777 RepID=A0AA43XLN6_9CLOT|nr:2-amino-4-oxopentanoate thiolase subunit OrtB [Isachenkonia alkalipeptolytica]NBG88726.1 PLP-dependent lyase/thiolase [Isachenkonia alkalipeptolytica]
MHKDTSYEAVMNRRGEIMKKSVGIDYTNFELWGVAFDYEQMMRKTGYSLEEVQKIQHSTGVGNTPLLELKNLTALARKFAPKGKGARIFIKDEAANPSGSYKARRASTSVYHAKKKGYKGVIAATSGNYGAAVASQAAIHGLETIVIQECYDSRGIGQPEIVEKARKCEAYGAEVVQLTVGPELFYTFLTTLEETGYFNASLYTPFGIAGVETLGYEIAMDFREREGKDPDAVICTNAGGGNLTGTARGLMKAGAEDTRIIGASVDLSGLHMASDKEFNRKSFTTGHTGFGMPYATWPDRTDVPRSAARPLRYMDEYYLVSQGEVFYMTEALAQIEGLERGPAGNTSLAVAFSLAQEMDQDQTIVVQETEYTGAGKHLQPQLSFARENGIEIFRGNPQEEIPGKNIILPSHPELIKVRPVDLKKMKASYVKNTVKKNDVKKLSTDEKAFIQEEVRLEASKLEEILKGLGVEA